MDGWMGSACMHVLLLLLSLTTPNQTSSNYPPGETANGKHPALVVRTMVDIVGQSELGISYHEQFHSIR
jgi:hypothetical protein